MHGIFGERERAYLHEPIYNLNLRTTKIGKRYNTASVRYRRVQRIDASVLSLARFRFGMTARQRVLKKKRVYHASDADTTVIIIIITCHKKERRDDEIRWG